MMSRIGLIAAMKRESAALLHHVREAKRITIGTFQGAHFPLAEKTCRLVTSGMGARRAGEATRKLMELYAPHILISFGIAGAVESDLAIGDVVLPESFCRFDHGEASPLLPLATWQSVAQQAMTQALVSRSAHLYIGTAVTSSGAQATRSQLGDIPHPILEMETAGIAQVAKELGIPIFSLRAISDGPVAPIPFDLGEMMDEDANLRTGRLLSTIIRNPAILLQSLRMMRNSGIAADNAAVSLLAALQLADFTYSNA